MTRRYGVSGALVAVKAIARGDAILDDAIVDVPAARALDLMVPIETKVNQCQE
jgi:hypothetical protein